MCVCNSSAGPGSEEEVGGNSRQRHNRHARDGGAAAPGSLEKRVEELEKVRFSDPVRGIYTGLQLLLINTREEIYLLLTTRTDDGCLVFSCILALVVH